MSNTNLTDVVPQLIQANYIAVPSAVTNGWTNFTNGCYQYNPYDNYTVLMMHMEGADNGTSFLDSCLYLQTVTRYTAVTKTGTKKFGTASAYFDGSGTGLSVLDSANWYFALVDYTIEAQIKTTSNGTICGVMDVSGDPAKTAFGFNVSDYGTSHKLVFVPDYSNYPSYHTISSTTSVDDGNWHHVAVTRASGVYRLFVDGNLEATNSSLISYSHINSDQPLLIGSWQGGISSRFTGYIDELRISKGIARWVDNFIAPTSAY